MIQRGNTYLLSQAVSILSRRLPTQWAVEPTLPNDDETDLNKCLQISAPGGAGANLRIVLKESLQPMGVLRLKEQATFAQQLPRTIVVSPFLSPSTREKLRELGFGYLDLTGNIWLSLDSPALYIETHGAPTNPNASERPARTLKGAKAGLLVRELIDSKTVLGVRDLAKQTAVDPGYISRVFALLQEQAIMRSKPRPEATERGKAPKRYPEWDLDWIALMRRWAQDAPFAKRGRVFTYIEPRGLKTTLARLTEASLKYAITGSYAAAEIAPVAPPRLLQIYVENAQEAAMKLNLRETESGTNVVLVESETQVPFLRSQQRNGQIFAAVSQVAADLLSSPGRAPAEAEELIIWMKENEETWRG